MFKNLANVFKQTLSKDKIAEMIKTSPEALAEFEAAYSVIEDDAITNAKQASALNRTNRDFSEIPEETLRYAAAIKQRIVDELFAKTRIWGYNGRSIAGLIEFKNWEYQPVENHELTNLPEIVRPQLTGSAMHKQITNDVTSETLLWHYQNYKNETLSEKRRKMHYHQFRQGLDILDLDPITYEILSQNKNAMSHWLPELVDACKDQDFFQIPKTVIVKVPLPILQMTRLDYNELTPATMQIINEWAKMVFALDERKQYFIKTGTYSSKFDFRNACVNEPKEVNEIGEYLTFIQHQATVMAGPLTQPSIYGMSTTNEWVVREFIPDKENNPTIYHGLPLHTEYRIFVDCDTDEIIGYNPYWDAEVMLKRFGSGNDADSPHQMHDYITYKAHQEVIETRYAENIDRVLAGIREILPKLNLNGQWSIDVMQNGDEFWLIDMALAENSAYYDKIPAELRRPVEEDWRPVLPEAK